MAVAKYYLQVAGAGDEDQAAGIQEEDLGLSWNALEYDKAARQVEMIRTTVKQTFFKKRG